MEDAAGAAQALVDQGLADPGNGDLGGSAGGYTVLNALIRYPGLVQGRCGPYPVAICSPLTRIRTSLKRITPPAGGRTARGSRQIPGLVAALPCGPNHAAAGRLPGCGG